MQAGTPKRWRAQRGPRFPHSQTRELPGAAIALSTRPVTRAGAWRVGRPGGSQAVAQPWERQLAFLSPSPGDPHSVRGLHGKRRAGRCPWGVSQS